MNLDWTWIDWAIVAVIFLSTIISLVRGFTREVLSLLTWIIAIWLAIKFTIPTAEFLAKEIPSITSNELRVVIAFVGLFIATLIVGSLLGYIISRLVNGTGLTGTDRLLGSIFGIARGVLVAVLLIIVAGFTPLIAQDEWKKSRLIPTFEPLAEWLLSYIPQEGTVAWLQKRAQQNATAQEKPKGQQPASQQAAPQTTTPPAAPQEVKPPPQTTTQPSTPQEAATPQTTTQPSTSQEVTTPQTTTTQQSAPQETAPQQPATQQPVAQIENNPFPNKPVLEAR